MPSVKTLIPKRRLRITLGSTVIEAELLSNATAELIGDALPCETEGALVNEEIVIPAPVYAPLEDGARTRMLPGEIAYRTVDQTIVIGLELPRNALSSEICMAGMATVFAQVLTDLENLQIYSERFPVKIETA